MKIIELFEEEGFDQDAIVELIRRDCKPYFDASPGNRMMYRGMRGKSKTKSFKGTVRADRAPRNTPEPLHKVMDDWFMDKFGFRARSNAMFATGHATVAGAYGSLYAVFPIGDFKFVWSPVIDDLSIDTGGEDPKDIPKLMDGAKYTDRNLRDAINSQNEIMVSCKEYYAMPLKLAYEDIQEFADKLFAR